MNREKGEGVPDFVLMDTISEEALMQNLKLRYQKDRIYTYIGEVVVSINPYKSIPELYSNKKIDEYKGRQMYEVPPHIYSLSNDVYRNMIQNYTNQCVIISGESGAGKTEASKVLMQYLSAVSKTAAYNKEVQNIKNQLLESNPVLEAFGNSKTLRNDNSSRFGKYMEIQFEPDGTPVGGKITNYLLEKSRVVTRAKGERSFHIFYQLLAGASNDVLGQFKLNKDPNHYNYLNMSECTVVDSIPDVTDFQHVMKATTTLGFTEEEKTSMWKVLAGILHLGNIQFKEDDKKKVSMQTSDDAQNAADMLGTSLMILNKVLTSRSITTGVGKRQSNISIPLNIQSSQFTRDALAKSIYFRLFDWIVDKINVKLATKTPGKKVVIGILDIYGFEVFENNSFEQFCINLCNEKLQQLFIELTLKSEQEEYLKEGIEWEPIQYFNNKIICDLIEGKPGIITMLDECCLMTESTDMTFLERLNFTFSQNQYYESYKKNNDKTIPNDCFRVKHYAGDVVYNVNGFLDKTKDTLFVDLVECMQTSSFKLLNTLFANVDTTSKKRPMTAATQFKNALETLMKTLLSSTPHYIRCIKPNDSKRANYLDEARVLHQVRYLGLLENIRVRRAGFCYKQNYPKFMHRYKMISKETWPGINVDAKAEAKKLMEVHKIKPEEYRFGKTKIFLRNPTTLFFLEDQRENNLPRIVTLIQTGWRGFVARRKFKQMKAAIMIQKHYKGYKVRAEYKKNKLQLKKQKAATRIIIANRRSKARKWLLTLAKTYYNIMSEKLYGKYLVWPQTPKFLPNPPNQTFLAFIERLKVIYENYRAKKMVESLNTEERARMRQKVQAYDIFKGKKSWDCARRYDADYLEMDSNPTKEKYIQGMQKIFSTYGEMEVLFSDYVNKVNKKGKSQKRAVVVTDKSIYKQDPTNYKVKKSEIPLSKISSISLSPLKDTFVIVHASEGFRDLVLDLGLTTGVEKYSELVTVLVDQYKKLNDTPLTVNFTEHIKYNNSRTPKNAGTDNTLNFQKTEDPKQLTQSAFKLGKGTLNLITYKTQ